MTRLEFPTPPDATILNRITEQDVIAWLVAKLHALRTSTRLPVYHIELEVWHRDPARCPAYKDEHYDASWSMHAPDICALTHQTISLAADEVINALGDTASKAAEKRRQAKILLHEATQLEAL